MLETNIVHNGLALEVIKKLPDSCIDSVITSPPYWQLRDYGFSHQWGLEKTFQEYLENLWSLMDELFRVLKESGTCWINLGDTYGTISGGFANGGTTDLVGKHTFGQKIKQPKSLHKCKLLIPHRFAIGCIDRGWILRNDIIWAKRNGMPESVNDRLSKKHEFFFFMVKSKDYYFDLDSIKDNFKESSIQRLKQNISSQNGSIGNGGMKTNGNMKAVGDVSKGKNPGDVSDFWDIPLKGSRENHFAQYNNKLIEKPIISGCPKGGVILDPFCGSGTTLLRSYELGRKVIGIEGSKDYYKIAAERLSNLLIQKTLF